MQRINTAYFYRLAQKLIPLNSLEGGADLYFQNFPPLNNAREELRYFMGNELVSPLTSFGNCETLLGLVGKIVDEPYIQDRKLDWGEVSRIKEALNHFEISLQSDLGMRDTFIVSPKGAYSTTLLAERGETALSVAVHALVPSLKQDMKDGCRCLAFELPTAAAFHFFRAVEAMAKFYGEFVRGKAFSEREKKGGLGSYSNLLKESSLRVDVRITNSLDQIAGLHRNPTMHPEMHITQTEVMATLGMVVSVIETLALDWSRRINSPGTALIEIIPDDSKVVSLLENGEDHGSNGQGKIRSSDASGIKRLEAGTTKTPRIRKKTGKSRKEAGA